MGVCHRPIGPFKPVLAMPAMLDEVAGYSLRFLLQRLIRVLDQQEQVNQTGEISMGTKIFTEADRKRTPPPATPKGVSLSTKFRGQRVSQERGAHTRSKKNPGKRAHSG